MKKVYLSGPIRNVPDGGRKWRQFVQTTYGDGFEWIDPHDIHDTHGSDYRIVPPEDAPNVQEDVSPDIRVLTTEEIVQTDKETIRGCDAVLVNWVPGVQSEGTDMEILHAHDHGVPVVVWSLQDRRSHGSFLIEHTDYFGKTLSECIEWLRLQ